MVVGSSYEVAQAEQTANGGAEHPVASPVCPTHAGVPPLSPTQPPLPLVPSMHKVLRAGEE